MADAYASGAYGGNPVEVQVLSSAPSTQSLDSSRQYFYTSAVLSSIRIRPLEWAFLALLVFSVLWRGGKSVDATWILTGVTSIIVLCSWLVDRFDVYGGSDRASAGVLPAWLRITLLAAVGWTALSYLTSETKNYGLDEVLRTASYALAFFIVVRLREKGQPVWLATAFPIAVAATATVASLIGSAVYVLQPVMRFSGTFFDARFHTDYWPNAWAEFLLIALPMTLVCLLQSDRRKLWWAACGGVQLAAMILSFSRGGMIALGGEVALLAGLLLVHRRSISRLTAHSLMLPVTAGLVATALIFSLNGLRSQRYDVESFTRKATFTASEGRSSVDERAQFWDAAMSMTMQRPILGWGPYSFRFVQPASMTSVLATSDHPHNAFLKMSAERGLPAALLFTLFILSILWYGAAAIIRDPSAYLKAGSFLGVAGVLAHTMIDYNLQFTGVGLPLFALLAFLAPLQSSAGLQTASFGRWKRRRRLNDAAAVLAGIVLFVAAWEGLFLVTSSLGRRAVAAQDIQNALSWYSLSHAELFSRDLFLSEAHIKSQSGDPTGALASLDRYQRLNPHDSRAWKIRGSVLLSLNRTAEALSALEQAYEGGRFTDAGILRLLLQTSTQNPTAAYRARKTEFDELFVAYAEAISANSHFIALSDNVEELQQIARILGRLFPSDAERYLKIARDAQDNARKERASFAARPPGTLW